MIDTKTPTIFTFQPAGRDEPVNIRTIDIESDPWFVAADVCRALDLDVSHGTTNYVGRLTRDEKRVIRRGQLPELFSGSFAPSLTLVSEPGLYALIQRSNKPEARTFQRWVNREVLPSIRKTGSYSLADHGREAMPLPMDIAEAMAGVRHQRISGGPHMERRSKGRPPQSLRQ